MQGALHTRGRATAPRCGAAQHARGAARPGLAPPHGRAAPSRSSLAPAAALGSGGRGGSGGDAGPGGVRRAAVADAPPAAADAPLAPGGAAAHPLLDDTARLAASPLAYTLEQRAAWGGPVFRVPVFFQVQ
jgi:hypothetical protein